MMNPRLPAGPSLAPTHPAARLPRAAAAPPRVLARVRKPRAASTHAHTLRLITPLPLSQCLIQAGCAPKAVHPGLCTP